MNAPRKTRHRSKAHQSSLIQRIVEADRSPLELAGEMQMSLSELSEWALQPDNAQTLEGLARLSDIRAQLLVSQYRATAAIRLIEIASAEKPTELARKACVDLLQTDLDVFEHSDSPPGTAQGPDSPSEETILAALERLGEEDP